MHAARARALGIVLLRGSLPAGWAGCSSADPSSSWHGELGRRSQSRYENLQAQSKTLAERAQAQQTEIENLKLHARNVENQLIRAEEDLARLDDRQPDPPKLASSNAHTRPRADFGNMPAELSSRLADLADRYPSLHYDEESGVSKFDTDVLFDRGEARLNPSARKMLERICRHLSGPRSPRPEDHGRGPYRRAGDQGREARSEISQQLASRAPAGPWPWSIACGRQGCRKTAWASPALPSISRFRRTTRPRLASATAESRSSSSAPRHRSSVGPRRWKACIGREEALGDRLQAPGSRG